LLVIFCDDPWAKMLAESIPKENRQMNGQIPNGVQPGNLLLVPQGSAPPVFTPTGYPPVAQYAPVIQPIQPIQYAPIQGSQPPTPPIQSTPPGQGQQNQGQGAQDQISQMHQHLAQALGEPVERVKQVFGDDPARMSGVIAQITSRALQQVQRGHPEPQPQPQFQPVGQTQQPVQLPANAEIPLPTQWEQMVKSENGRWVPTHPNFQSVADAKNHNDGLVNGRLRMIGSNPSALFQEDAVQKLINEKIKNGVEEALQTRQEEQLVSQFINTNGHMLFEQDPIRRGPLINPQTNKPLLSPLGMELQKVMTNLVAQGAKLTPDILQYGLWTASQNVGRQGGAMMPAQQPNYQPQAPVFQPQPPSNQNPWERWAGLNNSSNTHFPNAPMAPVVLPENADFRMIARAATQHLGENANIDQVLGAIFGP
jgi:hypothetical protein